MAAEQPGPRSPARRAALLPLRMHLAGVLVPNKGGRPPEEDDTFYHRMHEILVGDRLLGYAGAARQAAAESGIAVTEQLLDRTRRRYKKLLRQDFFSDESPMPGPVRRALEDRLALRAQRYREASEDLDQAETEAQDLGVDLSEDLDKLAARLHREVAELSLMISPRPHEIQIHGLTYGTATLEDAMQKYQDAKERHARAVRELETVNRVLLNRRMLEATRSSGEPEKPPNPNREN